MQNRMALSVVDKQLNINYSKISGFYFTIFMKIFI